MQKRMERIDIFLKKKEHKNTNILMVFLHFILQKQINFSNLDKKCV